MIHILQRIVPFLIAATLTAQSPTWDAARDFSATANPHLGWTYGWSGNRGAPLNAFTQKDVVYCSNLRGWSNRFPQFPAITRSPDARTECCTSVRLPAGQIALHPGQAGENAVLRWTAPADGDYYVEVDFAGVDFSFPTNSDVAVLHNLATLTSAELNSFDGPPDCNSATWTPAHSFRRVLTCLAGDAVDANVGFGRNQRYNGDSTLVRFRVTQVATSATVGTACPANDLHTASIPRLGSNVGFFLTNTLTGRPGVFTLSFGPPAPLPIGACLLYPSPAAGLGNLPFDTTPTGTWQVTLPLPADPGLHGQQLTSQTVVLPPGTATVLHFSNAVLLGL